MSDESPTVPEHLLGFRAYADWRDMSDYLVHFTDTEASFRSILRSGRLRASGPFGWARNIEAVRPRQMSACLSEVPLDRRGRLVRRHGQFGIGFTRDFIRSKGGGRVWYLDEGSPQSDALFARIGKVLSARDFDDELWSLTPFVDLVMPGRYEWDWEREWRVPGGFDFTLGDVRLLFTPEGLDEYAGLDVPFFHPKEETTYWTAIPEQLATEVGDMIGTFFQHFENPVESLPVDEGEYVWIVDQWDTGDAVADLFDELEPTVFERICDYLNEISGEWVRKADWDDFYE